MSSTRPDSQNNNQSASPHPRKSTVVHWRADSQVGQIGCPLSLRPWLLDRDSLTKRLVAASTDNFHVDVFNQQHSRPLLSEAQLLDTQQHKRAFIREVVLKGHNSAWVFGRTVIPLSTLTGRLRALRNLESRPLGALLFSEPSMTRGPVEVTRLQPDNPLLPDQFFAQQPFIWGRRSVFFIDNKPLLVNELFLPAFAAFINNTASAHASNRKAEKDTHL